jgi:hypothetical protein
MIRISAFCCFLFFSVLGQAQSQNGDDAYSLGVEGIQLIDDGQFDLGIKLLKKAHGLEPQDYDYTFEIGKAYLKNGNPKKAEKYLFDLQYHVSAQADLYLALSSCYADLEELKKAPNPERKKELDALRYGIQKLSSEGILYLQLGKKKLEMEMPVEALAVFESGIRNAPNFAENYFWSAKLMAASGNDLWAWFYAEICFNMTDDDDLLRSSAKLISNGLEVVLGKNWRSDPEKLDQDFKFVLSGNCATITNESGLELEKRKCLLENWKYDGFTISPLFHRMKQLEIRGSFEAYLATILHDNDKVKFLEWLSQNANNFEEYRNWRYWNPIRLKEPINRL